MQELPAFVANHWILSTLFVALFGALIWSFIEPTISGVTSIRPSDAVELINRQDGVLLDVRTDNEYLDGHIVNSIHIPLNFLKDRISELESHREHPIIVSCRSGNRSSQAAAMLRKAGFSKVHNLAGGIMAWQHANLPLSKKKK